MKLVLLMKDYSVKYSSNIKKYYNDIQFILFPCDEIINTYILVEPNKFMIQMKRARVIVESVVRRCGYDYKDHIYPIGRIKKVIYNYPDLIKYIFSIEKTKYYNNVMRMSDYDDIPPYSDIKYCFFSIKMYDENERVIFKKKINMSEIVKQSSIYVSDLFDPGYILNNIQDIYFSELSLFKEYLSINTKDLVWSLGHNSYDYDLCALWMDDTNSIRFFHKKDIKKIEKISSIYAMGYTITEEDRYTGNSPEYDTAYYEPSQIVEFITYHSYISFILRICACIANKEYDKSTLTEEDYIANTHMEIDIQGKVKSMRFIDDKVIDIDDILDLVDRRYKK